MNFLHVLTLYLIISVHTTKSYVNLGLGVLSRFGYLFFKVYVELHETMHPHKL